ncbi:hypothetical protein BO70DRAFT_397164 [Aspergillus heteromorphus CBS 117.55]|uniref:Zn(2)-C6 fungal-type domain-containing protein n=1 Tax=Aspergillus heteromorphus CBS 117.55 TaxID=1448321 RepID=A0A317W1D8_9EURO|nr:uncharacterized protein BO70DRAFT_397164 [Aspergillus heteromorphus CBS 117.55]PWY79689.1 hypothetical protein BO70DRAFT_397164 [Aspergillus heteromorphus CBS 117.55]
MSQTVAPASQTPPQPPAPSQVPSQSQPQPQSKPPLTRQACNRCHASKLRCHRPLGITNSKACSRCIKAEAECVYDPPQRFGRPRQKSRPQPATVQRIEAREGDGDASHSRKQSTSESRWSRDSISQPQSPYTAPGSPNRTAPVAGMDSTPSQFPPTAMDGGQDPLGEPSSEFLDAFQTESMQLDVDSYWSEDPSMLSGDAGPYADLLAASVDLDFDVTTRLGVDPTRVEAAGTDTTRPKLPRHPTDPLLATGAEYTADDYVFDVIQLQASVNQNNRELAMMTRKAQSQLVSEGRLGPGLSIPDKQFKTHLQRNLKASEQTLDVLHRINSHFTPGMREPRGPPDNLFGGCSGGEEPGLRASDPQHSILAFLVLTTYLRLLHNFDVLISILQDRLQYFGLDPGSNGPEDFPSDTGSNPLLDVSLGNFSFSSSSARSLQAMLNVQMITTVLAKIKYSIQRMLLCPEVTPPSTRGPGASSAGGSHHSPPLFFHPHAHSLSDHGLSQTDARGYHHGPYHSHMARHHSYPTPPELASTSSIASGNGSPPPFVSGVDNVVRRALVEIQDLELSLRIRARAIQQWSEEGF